MRLLGAMLLHCSGRLRVRFEERLGKPMCLSSLLETIRESQQHSGTALGRLRVQFGHRLGQPNGFF